MSVAHGRRPASGMAAKLGLSQLPSGSLTLFVALAVVNVSGYVFYVVASRLLSPARYGALGALIAIITIISVPATSIHMVTARRTALLDERADLGEISALLRMLTRGVALFGGAIAAVLLATSPLVARFLRLGSVFPATLLAAFVFVGLISPVLRGAVHGLLHYRALAAALFTMTIVRVGLGILLIARGWDVTGATLAFLVAEVCGAIPTVWALRTTLRPARPTGSVAGLSRELWRACLAVAGFAAVTNLDVTQVRHYFPNRASGLYAAASVVGRGVLVGSLSITMLIYPRFASSEAGGEEARSALRWAFAATAGVGAVATFVVAFAGHPLMRLIFGSQYAGAATVAAVCAAGSALFSLSGLLMYFHLARSSSAAFAAVPALVVQSAAIALWHPSILEVEWLTAIVATALLLVSSIVFVISARRPPSCA